MPGINQTVVFALFMIIFGAMSGTEDLGQLILKSVLDKHGIGNGIVPDLCFAFIGLAVGHLIIHCSSGRKKAPGLL